MEKAIETLILKNGKRFTKCHLSVWGGMIMVYDKQYLTTNHHVYQGRESEIKVIYI